MKKAVKTLAGIACVATLAVPFAANAAYEPISADKNTINIVVDGERVFADNFLYNDTTYVPLRRVAEMLGMNVDYNEAENTAYITDGGEVKNDGGKTEIIEEAGQSLNVERNTISIYVNGAKVDADNFVYNDRTYVPLRKISEMLSRGVDWNQLTNTATIGTKAPSVFEGTVVGSINGRDYTDKLLDGYKSYFEKVGGAGENAEAQAKEQILQDYVLIDLAEENGITAGVSFENDYEKMLTALYTQYGGKESFEALLPQSGYTPEMYRYIQMMNYIYSKACDVLGGEPTAEEIEKYYDENKDTAFAFDGVRAKHVLIMPEQDEDGKITDEQWKAAEKKAKKVYELAKNGTDFDSLIAEYNQDPGVKSNPDGYTFGKGQMVQEFEDKCYSMNVGEVSEPVKTDYGYHVIKLEEKLSNYKLDDDVKSYITDILKSQNLFKLVEERINTAENVSK